MVTQLRCKGVEGGQVWGGRGLEDEPRGEREGDRAQAPVIYDAMNKTRTKYIQDDATRAANTRVIFEELKIFYEAMTPRCDLRPGPPNSGEAYPSRSDTFLVARFRSCMSPIACSAFRYIVSVSRDIIIIITLCFVNEEALYYIYWYSLFICEILSENLVALFNRYKAYYCTWWNATLRLTKMFEKMND